MIGRWILCLACFAGLVSPSADAQRASSVTIRVSTDGQNCIVYTQQMRCDAVGQYLRDDRHLPFSQLISVFPDGTGKSSQARGMKVRRQLAKGGYSKVIVVAFLTEPGTAPNTSP